MKPREAKEKAQDYLMQALGSAFYYLDDDRALSEEDREAIRLQMNKQFERVETLFGFVAGSHAKG